MIARRPVERSDDQGYRRQTQYLRTQVRLTALVDCAVLVYPTDVVETLAQLYYASVCAVAVVVGLGITAWGRVAAGDT